MKIGDTAIRNRIFSKSDIDALGRLTGLPTPSDCVPEPLINALFSDLLGMDLPGPGTNYLKQETCFEGLALPGDVLTACVEITRLRPEKKLVDLKTICRNSTGEIIAIGRALVLFRGAATDQA